MNALESIGFKLGRALFLRRDADLATTLQDPRSGTASNLNARSNVTETTFGARFLPRSQNSKLSRVDKVPNGGGGRGYQLVNRGPLVASTYVSIERTCPAACPFKGAGCYADAGFTRVLGQRLDRDAAAVTPLQVAKAEAELIDAAWPKGVPQDGARGGRDLRLHVGGEFPSEGGARVVAAAVDRWLKRGGGAVWSFTHRWASIARSAFGRISVLASCETPAQAWAAIRRGYVPALVVDRFPNGAKAFTAGGLKFIPCPGEVNPGKVTCSSCRLCLNEGELARRALGIAFAVHGPKAAEAAKAIGGAR